MLLARYVWGRRLREKVAEPIEEVPVVKHSERTPKRSCAQLSRALRAQLHSPPLARIEFAMAEHVRRVRRKRRVKRAPRQAVHFHPGPPRHLRWRRSCSGSVLALLLLTYGPQAYSGWRESRLLKRATELLAKEDFDGATRAAREVLQIHHDSLAAFHVLAEASEKQNRPETVAWRAQIARLEPENLDSQLNLASAALRFGQLDTARKALENVAAGATRPGGLPCGRRLAGPRPGQ